MTIKYANDEIKVLLCKEFLIIKDNGKKSFLDYFIKKEEITEKQKEQLNNCLIDLFTKIGYEHDIELTDYDNKYVYGKIDDTIITFNLFNNKLTTFEGNDTNYDKHEYLIRICYGNYGNKSFKRLNPQKYMSVYKRANQITRTMIDNKQYNTFNITVSNQKRILKFLMDGHYANEEKLIEYLINLDLNKNVKQIINDVLLVLGLTIEEIKFINIGYILQGVLTERIEYKNGELVFLGESKNGRGYSIHQGKMEIHINGLNVNEKYEIDFDDENAILTIAENKFLIPLDLLACSGLMNSTKEEKASEDLGNVNDKLLRKRREDISQ